MAYNKNMTSLRLALAQIDTCVGNISKNTDEILRFCKDASSGNADIVVFPEMTLTGYPIEDLALRATFRKAANEAAYSLAESLKDSRLGDLYVVVGTVGVDDELGKPRNRLLVIHDGKVELVYDKHFLPNYGVFDEFRIFSSGNDCGILNVKGTKLGFAICEDIWQDGGPVARLSKEGIDVLVTINGSPYEEGKTDIRLKLAQKRAKEVNAPLVYVNQVGAQDDLVFDGGSFVVNADGSLIERSKMFDQDLSFVDFDTDLDAQKCSTIAQKLDPDEEVYCACVLGLRDYMRKNGFKGVCLGLSGGIDSALVATMAADACGGQNVWGISMPSMYSSLGSKDDACDLAQRLGAHYDVQPIEPLFKSFQNQLDLQGIAAENLQARVRGVIVMAYSNSKGLLALATGNKSELACGYSTIYGDAVGGYAPIKDLFKTRVWALSKWRNRAAKNGVGLGMLPIAGSEDFPKDNNPKENAPKDGILIPVNSIIKPPSAELRPGQKDSDSLPEYDLLDKVLEAHIELAHGRADLLADGFDERTVDTVIRLVDRAEWKRRQYPLGPKVSAIAFGRDRRIPVTTAFRE